QAIISFPGLGLTDLAAAEDGTYQSYPLKQGTVKVEVRHPQYVPWSGSALVEVQKVTTLDVQLAPKAPEVGEVIGTVTDKDGKPLAATLEVEGVEKRSVTAGADGTFSMTLKPGAYRIKAGMAGYFSRHNAFAVNAGTKQSLEFKLTPKPKRSVVVITKTSLKITKTIHFEYNKAAIQPDSLQILDEVAEVLNDHPEIQHVEIQGHTDRRGGWDHNLKLSQSRSDAVRDYLISQGIDPSRLDAKGYGAKRPLVPELTPRHRAINRRVEFRITRRGN
ncbi:MAG: OmpA family protein, partial [Polyangia bacterium]|nr:OmpA family protein [Polyangia bacterium]